MTEITSETALRLKQLELKFENLEADVKMSDCCFNELEVDQEEAGNKIDMIEKRVTQLEVDLEERVATLNLQNVELRDHVNLLVDMVNNITRVLNGNIEQAGVDEVDSTQSNDESMQPTVEQANSMKTPFFHDTVQQVYDMYLSQPKDEEGWQEMTTVIKPAEECEDVLKERVNGLTEDEWNDLLRI